MFQPGDIVALTKTLGRLGREGQLYKVLDITKFTGSIMLQNMKNGLEFYVHPYEVRPATKLERVLIGADSE